MRSVRLFAVTVLAVLVVSAMPASAGVVTLVLTPHAACPGEEVQVFLPEDNLAVVDGGSLTLFSDPEGLIADYQCASFDQTLTLTAGNGGLAVAGYQLSQVPSICSFRVGQSATCNMVYGVMLQYGDVRIGAAKFQVLCNCAVGGGVQPVPSSSLIAPWLAVIGVVGCIATVAVIVRKRHP